MSCDARPEGSTPLPGKQLRACAQWACEGLGSKPSACRRRLPPLAVCVRAKDGPRKMGASRHLSYFIPVSHHGAGVNGTKNNGFPPFPNGHWALVCVRPWEAFEMLVTHTAQATAASPPVSEACECEMSRTQWSTGQPSRSSFPGNRSTGQPTGFTLNSRFGTRQEPTVSQTLPVSATLLASQPFFQVCSHGL